MSARFPACDAANWAARVLRAMPGLCSTFLLPIGATLFISLTDRCCPRARPSTAITRSSIKWVF